MTLWTNRFRNQLGAFLVVSAFWLGSDELAGHPLQAEPVEHPYVFAFDQFHLPEDPDDHVAEGGFLLLKELRCAACHPASDERWSAPPAPDLETVGSRLREDAIWRMIRSPQHSKKGTLMPGLFTGAEGDDEDVEALTVFLASLQRSNPVTAPPGDAGRGRELYHEVGCVACHEPATDYRPVAPPPGLPVEKPGLASVPIALASAYQPNELAMFLRQPLAHRPSARMPAQLQSIQEAADIASYLQLDEPFEPAAERKVLAVPPQTVERGRKVFRERRCDQCHALGDEAPLPSTAELAELVPSRGCLSGERTSGIPFYDLSDLQTRALRLALAAIRDESAVPPEPLAMQLASLNCYACHDRDGKGGPEDPRAQYFSNRPLPSTPGFHPYPLPPTLDDVEIKMTGSELQQALRGHSDRHPETTVRMPDFGGQVSAGIQRLLLGDSHP